MTSTSPIIVVFGGTGYQGGSVIDALLKTEKYRLRVVTRDPQSSPAQKLSAANIEVVAGDANQLETLKQSFEGASAAFLASSFWDESQHLNPETDWLQGKNLVDAAVASGTVRFVVWSSLDDIDHASNGSLTMPHFTNKHRVEQYIRTQTKLQAAFVYAGFYFQNWINFPSLGAPTWKSGKVVLETAMRADVALPLIDIEQDFGKFVAPLFSSPDTSNGQVILAATEYLTVPQMAHIYEKVSGLSVQLIPLDYSALPMAELQATLRLFNGYGYYVGKLLEPSLARYTTEKFSTFENWLRRSKFQPHLSES